MSPRGLTDGELMTECARRSTMDERAEHTLTADKVLVFLLIFGGVFDAIA